MDEVGVDSKIKLVVLDLDETLIYATDQQLSRVGDYKFNEYHIYRRPHLDKLISYCIDNFDVGIWSSAGDDYVSFVSEQLFKDKAQLKFAWGGARCIHRSSGISNIKDLRKLRRFGYWPYQILMIDDSLEKVCRQPKSLVKVEPYDGSLEDNGLLNIIDELESKRKQFD